MASYIYIKNTYSITYVAYIKIKDIYQQRYQLSRYFSTWEGFIMIVQTQLKVYAGNAPNATMKQEYSAPEEGIIVPNSAYARAPLLWIEN